MEKRIDQEMLGGAGSPENIRILTEFVKKVEEIFRQCHRNSSLQPNSDTGIIDQSFYMAFNANTARIHRVSL
jgi:hypothetical protein